MMRILASLLVAIGVSACQDGTRDDLVGEQFSLERPRGTYVRVAPNPDDTTPRFGPGPQHRVVYMNKNGGTFNRGSFDNSSTNLSSIPSGTASVSAWTYGDANWNQLMACVRDIYAPFDVTITDVDPGDTPHVESVVGGRPGQI